MLQPWIVHLSLLLRGVSEICTVAIQTNRLSSWTATQEPLLLLLLLMHVMAWASNLVEIVPEGDDVCLAQRDLCVQDCFGDLRGK